MHFSRRRFLKYSSVAATASLLAPGLLHAANDDVTHPEDPAMGPQTPVEPGGTPDLRKDPKYLDHSIRHISDEDLFEALDLSKPALASVRAAAEKKDYPAAYVAWGDYWKTVGARGMFQDVNQFLQKEEPAAKSFEATKAQVLSAAARLLKHDIQGWGDISIQHGPVVNFNADYGENGKYGFGYWDWSRPLIQAYLITKDQKYLAEFDTLFNQWYDQRDKIHGNIPTLDVVYYELGLSLRTRPFLEYYYLPYKKRSPQTHEHMLKAVLGAARWLYQEEKRKYRDGNWQIMGSYGLSYIGLMVPEFGEANEWVKLGSDRMLAHTRHDMFKDGCHSERVPSSYMLIAYRDPRNLGVMLGRDERYQTLAKQLAEPLEKTLNWYLYCTPPDGYLPAINDGGRPPVPPGLMQDGYELHGRRDMLWVEKHLLGQPTAGDGEMPKATSMHFAPSGFTFMRSDWTPEARYMLINHGPSGGGHSHQDALSFELNAYGMAMAIDAGIGLTYDDPHQANWYRQAKAHNMLLVDGSNPDRAQAEGVDVIWTSNDQIDYLAATHHGYDESRGVIHRRHFVFVKPGYFVIYDVVESKRGDHDLSWNLHTTVNLAPDSYNPKSIGPGMLILPSDDSWTSTRSNGIADTHGIRGFPFGHAIIDWLAFDGKVQQSSPTTFAVALYPYPKNVPNVQLKTVTKKDRSSHFSVETPDGIDHLLFGDIDSAGFTLRGAFAHARQKDGKIVSSSASKATQFTYNSQNLLS